MKKLFTLATLLLFFTNCFFAQSHISSQAHSGMITNLEILKSNDPFDFSYFTAGNDGFIVKWSEDPAEFIAASLSPSKVLNVEINFDEKSAKVTVPESQLSLAIGKSGQNVRLAARLTGWKIDISAE